MLTEKEQFNKQSNLFTNQRKRAQNSQNYHRDEIANPIWVIVNTANCNQYQKELDMINPASNTTVVSISKIHVFICQAIKKEHKRPPYNYQPSRKVEHIISNQEGKNHSYGFPKFRNEHFGQVDWGVYLFGSYVRYEAKIENIVY